MTITEQLSPVSVATKANVYFDGLCVSHSLTLADGSRKSVGVVLAAELSSNTGEPEVMECVAGACEYRLAGQTDWSRSTPGERFAVPAGSRFDIRVSEVYHYICHFG